MSDAPAINGSSSLADESAPSRDRSSQRPLVAALALALGYVVGVHVGLALTFAPNPVSTLWPPNAILLAALLLVHPRTWWMLLVAVLPAHLVTQTLLGVPLAMSLCWYVSNSAEALLGAALTLRYCGHTPRFDRVRDLSVFLVAGVLVAPLLSSFLDAAFVALVQWRYTGYWQIWRIRLFSNSLAALTLVPLIVTWVRIGWPRLQKAKPSEFVETATLLVAICVISFIVFQGNYSREASAVLLYAPLPILVWAAVRRSVTTVSLCVAIVALIAIAGVLQGRGPFAATTTEDAALAVQTFLIIAASSLMLLAATLAEMRHARRVVHMQKESLDLALEAAQMGTWEWDVGRDAISWHIGKAALSNDLMSRATLLTDLMSRIHVDDRDAVLRTMHGALASRESCEIEFRFTCRDGSVRWITSRGKIVQDPEGRANRIIGVYVDTTDRKLQDLQMRTHQEQLAHLSRVSLLGELSGALAHELNQPLAAILLNAQAACNEIGKPDPDMREIAATLDDIVADDRRAGEVIRKLRALFLRGAVQVRPVSVNECIGEVLALEHTHLIARKATVDVRLDATLPLVLADRVQLQQVLLNLIVNACDAMASNEPADRRIRIESMRGEPGEILVHVRDNGDGVSNTEAIFQPFYSTKDHGLGLGLAVSRTIISAQRGRLWATQNASRGATFHIALPEAREEPERNG